MPYALVLEFWHRNLLVILFFVRFLRHTQIMGPNSPKFSRVLFVTKHNVTAWQKERLQTKADNMLTLLITVSKVQSRRKKWLKLHFAHHRQEKDSWNIWVIIIWNSLNYILCTRTYKMTLFIMKAHHCLGEFSLYCFIMAMCFAVWLCFDEKT